VLAARCRRFRGATVDHPAPPASPRRARNFSREGACAQRAPRAGSRSAGGRVRLERFFAVSGWCTVPTMFSPQQKRRRTDTEPIDLSGEEPIDLRPEDGQDVIDLTGERPAARRRPLRLGRRRRGHRIDCRRCRLRTEAPAVVRRLGRGSGSGHVRFGGARRLGRRFAHRATASTASRGSVVRGQERRSGRPPRDERGVAARPASLRALRGRVAARPRQERAIGLPRDRGVRDGLDPRRRGGKNGQMGGTGEPVRCVGTDQKSRHCGRRERATSTKRSRRRRRRGAVPTDAKRPRTGTSARRCEPRPSTAIEDRGRC